MWLIIIALLLIGLVLMVVELVFIPGTTVVGILGLIFSIAGVIISYRHFGNETGFYVLISTGIVTGAALFYSFRSNAWTRFSLKSSNRSKVNEGMISELHVGDEGKTISTLRPVGKAEFNERQFEVKTLGDYVDKGIKVKILHIQANNIIVKPLN